MIDRNPIFKIFLLSSTVSLIGSSIFDISLPLYILERTQSPMSLALAAVCLHLPHFLMAPITAFTSDHLNKRWVMLGADIGQIVCLCGLMFYLHFGGKALWPVYLGIFLCKSLMLIFENVTTFQLIPSLVPTSELSTANSRYLILHRFIQIVGPAFGGILLTVFGISSCILINILSFSATLYFTFRVKNLDELIDANRIHRAAPLSLENVLRDCKTSLQILWKTPLFRSFIYMMFLWNLSSWTLNSPTLSFYFTGQNHFSAAQYGTVVAWFGVLGMAGFIISPSIFRSWSFPLVFQASALVQAITCTVALISYGHPYALALGYAASRVASSMLSMGTFFIRQTQVPKERMGSINAYLRMFFMSAAPLSSLFQGFLIERLGLVSSLIFGTISLWGTVYFTRQVSKHLTEVRITDETRDAA